VRTSEGKPLLWEEEVLIILAIYAAALGCLRVADMDGCKRNVYI